MADAMVLGAIGRPCRFESCYPHQIMMIRVLFSLRRLRIFPFFFFSIIRLFLAYSAVEVPFDVLRFEIFICLGTFQRDVEKKNDVCIDEHSDCLRGKMMEKMRQCRWLAKGCIKFLFLSLLVCIWGQKSDAKESNGLNFQELNSKTTQIEVLQKTVKGLASGNELPEGKTYSGPYSFWCGNLDDDVEPEMIVGVIEMDEWDRPVERLLVFDLKGKEEVTSELLFITDPPIPIRYGFASTADGERMVFNCVVSAGTGEISEGIVRLNDNKTELVYTETGSYSLADGGSSSFETEDTSGCYDPLSEENTYWGPLASTVIKTRNLVLGVDNNSFYHTEEGLNKREKYEITEAQKKVLLAGEKKGTAADIERQLSRERGGICYGISAMMGLVKEEKLWVSDFDTEAMTFFGMETPNTNDDLYHELCYLYMMQFLMEKEDYNSIVHTGWFGRWKPDDLKSMVEEIANSDKQQMLTYSYDGGGHAVVVKDLISYPTLGIYDLVFYDINSVREENPDGFYYHMYIKDDYSDFVIQSYSHEIRPDNFSNLQLIDIDKIVKHKPVKVSEEDVEELDSQTESDMIESGKKSIISVILPLSFLRIDWDSSSEGILLEDGQMTGETQAVNWMPSIVNDLGDNASQVYSRMELPDSGNYSIKCSPDEDVNLSINTGEGYYFIEANGIEDVSVSAENGIAFTGDDFTFQAGQMLTGNEEVILAQAAGTGTGTVSISETGNELHVNSQEPVQIESITTIQNMEVTRHEVNQETTDFIWKPDSTPKIESSVNWSFMLGVGIPVLTVSSVWFVLAH